MKEIDAKLEALMGKLLDGEITPAEQRILDEGLQRDAEARELLTQMRLLTECSREAVAAEIAEHGKGAEETLSDIGSRWASAGRPAIFKFNGRLRFVAGLAAGFLLGLLLHFALIWNQSESVQPVEPRQVAVSTPDKGTFDGELVAPPMPDRYQPMIRNVDWYGFTDNAGRQWLVQGVREGIVHPAVYNQDSY